MLRSPSQVRSRTGSISVPCNQLTEPLSLGRFLAGLISIGIIGFVIGAVFAWSYNALRRV